MRIALLGYGKMGREIEKVALARHHEIVHKISVENPLSSLDQTDVAIDFSTPEMATKHIGYCLEHDIPVISGTTGWLADYDTMTALCRKNNGAFIYASNFSLGVNLFFKLNKKLHDLMRGFPAYDVRIEEVHHTEKKDAPSGTAITLAQIITENSNFTNWTLDENSGEHEIPITALRIADVKGKHTVSYTSEIDQIQITHEAFNRTGFALGAVIAAEWILGKKGIFTMDDVLNIG